MAKKEKFGKFVLLEEVETSGLGTEYRAAKLGPTGLEKIVSVLRLGSAVSSNADVAKSLMDQAKVAAQLQSPNVVKIYGIGKVDAAYYISYEFIEGKSLKAIFNRCRQEGFPFSVDHTLLIASKICSALEYAHGRKTEAGGRYYHGLLTPAGVIVSYEGEVRVRGFGYWPGRVREAGLSSDESLYLAPEQSSGGTGDTRSDIFTVGAILYETLTGHALFEGGRTADLPARLSQARLQSPSGDDDSLPKPISEILHRALAADPAGRYAEVQEMRKAIDTLLFSGDFTPTTFNLAFFMHSLFREDIERESKSLKEEKEAGYLEYLTEEPAAKITSTTLPGTTVTPRPAPAATMVTPTPLPLVPPPPRHEPIRPLAAHREDPAGHHEPPHREHHPLAEPPGGLTAKEAAAGFTFHKDEPKGKAPLYVGLAAVVLLGGAVTAYMLVGRGGSGTGGGGPSATTGAAPPTLTAEAAAALARVKELEDKLKKLEDEKLAAEEKAKEDAAAKVKKEAQARGQAVDPAALEKAQREAADKARQDQERRAQEERRRLEEEKRAEEARLAEEKRKADEAARIAEEQRKADEARKAAEAAATATTLPPTTVAALRAGSLVNLSDAGVVPPMVDRSPLLQYPPIALRQRVEGTVELNVLVDEKGQVVDAQIVTAAGGKSGLNEAAVENVKKRKYRPATKDGIPVKVWIPVRVKFELPR
ncbi:MAG: TonB family protein [Acidobacteria bacterium]|nr:TonB family protein [Acidobacteriota bacterium]